MDKIKSFFLKLIQKNIYRKIYIENFRNKIALLSDKEILVSLLDPLEYEHNILQYRCIHKTHSLTLYLIIKIIYRINSQNIKFQQN